MYNLYDVFRDKNEIIKSVGLEYANLDYKSLILLLISNLQLFNMLEGNSNNVINNSRFYKLLFDTNYLKKYKNMYFLDVLLLEMNNSSSKALIKLHGSESAIQLTLQCRDLINNTNYDSDYSNNYYDNLIPSEIVQQILLNETDLDIRS